MVRLIKIEKEEVLKINFRNGAKISGQWEHFRIHFWLPFVRWEKVVFLKKILMKYFNNVLIKPVYLPYHNLLGNLWPFQQLIDQNKDSDKTKTFPYTYRYEILRDNFGTYLSLPCSVGWCFRISLHFLAFTIFIRLIQSKSPSIISIFGFLLCILH